MNIHRFKERLPSSQRLFAAVSIWALLLTILPNSVVAQTSGQVVPPEQSWSVNDDLSCDFSTPHLFQSSWPGDSPENAMAQYVTALNAQCSGQAGANLVASFRANPCTPTILVSGFGSYPSEGLANGCTYHVHADPKPGCTPAWMCATQDYDNAMPVAKKICPFSDAAVVNPQFTLTSPPTYGECKCPNGSVYSSQAAACKAVQYFVLPPQTPAPQLR